MSAFVNSHICVALGGHVLQTPENFSHCDPCIFRHLAQEILELKNFGAQKILIVHGNGPQVGALYEAQKGAVSLDACVAQSQGWLGYLLQNSFPQSEGASTLLTRVIVDPKDGSFVTPTKAIGPFYQKKQEIEAFFNRNWVMKFFHEKGWRRVVPSPIPLEVVERESIHNLWKNSTILICAGGGGIPVIRETQENFKGVEAVVDKDETSALLANQLDCQLLLIVTHVDFAYLDYQTPQQRPLTEATTSQLERYLAQGHFHEGSMGPKVEAILKFVTNPTRKAIICGMKQIAEAMRGKRGTHVIYSPKEENPELSS